MDDAVGPAAVEAVGRLASYVATTERGEPAVQPVASDGRFELVPLHTMQVGRIDLARIRDAAAHVVAAGKERQGDEALLDAVDEWSSQVPDLVGVTERLRAVLGLEWDDDVDVLHACLGGTGHPRRLVLDEAQMDAYQRVSQRILATWSAGDRFAGFEWFGTGGA